MGNGAMAVPDPIGMGGFSRRDALRRGAVIAGAAFVIPVVQTISIKPAAAQGTSGGRNYTGGDTGGNQDGNSQGGKGANDQ
jgi:hypothetical protein